jgi:hypothetical protein
MREIIKGLETLNVFLIGFFLFYFVITRFRLPSPEKWRPGPIVIYSATAFFVYYISIALIYAFSPSFIDHIEPSVAMKSLLAGVGGEVYTGLDSVDRISTLYGPSCFIFSMLFQKIIPDPIYASKLAGVFSALGGIVILFLLFRKTVRAYVYLFSLGYMILIFLLFRHFSFWNRPDSAIIFGCCLSCAGLMISRKSISVFLTALGIGIAVNAKVHAFLYLLPLLPLYIQLKGLRIFPITILLSCIIILLPYWLFDSFSLANYIDWLLSSGKHPFRLLLFLQSLSHILILSVPVVVMAIMVWLNNNNTGQKMSSTGWSVVLLVISGLLVSLISAKAQAGYYHILGFAPIIATLLVYQLKICEKDGPGYTTLFIKHKRVVISIGLSLAIVLAVGVFKGQKKVVEYLAADQSHDVRNDLHQITSKYNDKSIMMGYGGLKGYENSFLRPLLFDAGASEFVDAPALMDMLASGIKMPDMTIQKVSSRPFDIILIPKGDRPFSLKSFYLPHERLFAPEFVTAFNANYHLVDSTDYYTVWAALQPTR